MSSSIFSPSETLLSKLQKIHYPLAVIPGEYLCPIGGTLMENPVVASDGYTYEEKNSQNEIKVSFGVV